MRDFNVENPNTYRITTRLTVVLMTTEEAKELISLKRDLQDGRLVRVQ
jgi:hypothetical protein